MAPCQSAVGNPPRVWNRDFESLLPHMDTSLKLPEESFFGHRQNILSTTADYPGAVARETEQLDCYAIAQSTVQAHRINLKTAVAPVEFSQDPGD